MVIRVRGHLTRREEAPDLKRQVRVVAFGTKMFWGGGYLSFPFSGMLEGETSRLSALPIQGPLCRSALPVTQRAVGMSDLTGSLLPSQEPAATPETWTTLD